MHSMNSDAILNQVPLRMLFMHASLAWQPSTVMLAYFTSGKCLQ